MPEDGELQTEVAAYNLSAQEKLILSLQTEVGDPDKNGFLPPDRLEQLPNDTGLPIRVRDGNSTVDFNYDITRTMPLVARPDLPIEISDIRQFLRLGYQVNAVGSKIDPLDRKASWIKSRNIRSVWLNATPLDISHPESFMENQLHQWEDETFIRFDHWTPIGRSEAVGKKLFVNDAVPTKDYESPHELVFAFSNEDQYPKGAETIPAVRYGRSSDTEVTVYAVQMPMIGNLTERQASLNEISRQQQTKNLREFLVREYQQNEAEYIENVGTIPEEIRSIEDPSAFVIAYSKYLQENPVPTIAPNEEVSRVDLRYKSKTVTEVANKALEVEAVQALIDKYLARRGNVSELNAHMKGNVPTELRRAPSAAVISASLAVELFHQEGIRTIKIPKELPLRAHGLEPEIDQRIKEQNKVIWERVAHEIDGVTITDEDENWMTVTMGDTISTQRPLLKELYGLLQKN